MSILDDTPQSPQTNEAVVAEPTVQETQPQESFVQKLVETRGEKWGDPEVVAKGKVEADAHILALEGQLSQMREDLGKQDYAAELLTQLQNKATDSTDVQIAASNNNNISGTETVEHTSDTVSEDDLKSLVEKTLTERDAKTATDNNLADVATHLESLYGTEADANVMKKAEELGMTWESIKDIAKTSPAAFFALLGEAKAPVKNLSQGSIRTDGVMQQNTGERNWAYYSSLRRENKSAYYTPKVQQQLLEDKKRLGSKFGA
jgi:hypothetical protein